MGRSGPVRSGPEKTGLLAKTGPDRFIKPVHKPVYQIRSTYWEYKLIYCDKSLDL